MATTETQHVTIRDIAQMAGTSKTTVSFYINGKTDKMSTATQERIKAAIEKTGYAPNPLARSLNAKRSFLLGVVIGDITNTFSNRIVKGIGSVAKTDGYRMLVSSSNYDRADERAYIERLLSVGVDGFIVQPTGEFKAVTEAIEKAGKPLVFFDSKLYDFSSSWVKTDNYEATYKATEAVVNQGYERFVIISAEPKLLSTRIERYSGFVDALDAHDQAFEQLIIDPDTLSPDLVEGFLREHVDGEVPTLVFAPNCWALPDIYVGMRPFYPLMPEKVGLLGFDNVEWTSVACPSVSCIEQPAFEEGHEAARILIDLIDGKESVDRHKVLDCAVAWRGSTREVH
ncbi:MAG: LacI family DNA-binding transcriptional regulator [Atopobiaceae bacterium]|jgi:DNA-binding LacI/PurR family transcriptional regulator|nr:LacI family DNA-binding transcriptional regulator [Atopobiaceae bacterium]MCH4179834.1 LacI family DNA-binding transcriptional regulator [Atopobiaceae bacterium]MCH4213585.1 LacI family DNA-binding transcriptional regulator [Atopobiaceae bacterium]MCH4276233.1 LacI family DNA-binding transcriptional regulator [Atopobiaceae bacterium]MCI1226046.1 LacI family DNA-binding transcriptional regulator [Atopobiaceae bacterium]